MAYPANDAGAHPQAPRKPSGKDAMADEPQSEVPTGQMSIVWPKEFERIGKPNGSKYWLESDYREALGYKSEASWRRVVNRASHACMTLDIPTTENFIELPGGGRKLTRFACYLIAMNADPKKAEVAAAQVYLAKLAETLKQACDHADGVERVIIRDELTDGQKTLASTAKNHGVENFGFFANAGYLGMYNMSLGRLCDFKRLPEGQRLLDWMGKEELAANLFRVTQTEMKIKKDEVHGQRQLERVAREVGQKVRHTMLELSGVAPEDLELAEPIVAIKKAIKGTRRKFKELDAARAGD
jgi:DNA-damage-inducible protein D